MNVGDIIEITSTFSPAVIKGDMFEVVEYNQRDFLLKNTTTAHDVILSYREAEQLMYTVVFVDIKEPAPSTKGGSSANQYRKALTLPLTNSREEHVEVDLEVMDVCQAWGFQQEEHNILKAFSRDGKKDSGDELYDARKVMLFALQYAKRKGLYTNKEFWEYCVSLGLSEEI